jgi:hypothetical protein
LSTLPSAIPPSQIGETRTEKKEQILLQGKKIVFSPKGVFYTEPRRKLEKWPQ